MEKMGLTFWKGKRVFVTGHTGFKGTWLSSWLKLLGAEVFGFSLKPTYKPSMYDFYKSTNNEAISDIRDYLTLKKKLISFQPEIIFHLAAQPLVSESYSLPLETYQINVLGTANLLYACKGLDSIRVLINVTSDKCYENMELDRGYHEEDLLGGYDPYSNSKACSELVTKSFRDSFFSSSNVGIASARAGNIIGGGDWSDNRLIPDIVRFIYENKKLIIRNPNYIRPWQHILDALHGYLILAEALFNDRSKYSSAWNFGPNLKSFRTVSYVLEKFINFSNTKKKYYLSENKFFHETSILKLDCSKSKKYLGWQPKLTLNESLNLTFEWYENFYNNHSVDKLINNQINNFMKETPSYEKKS